MNITENKESKEEFLNSFIGMTEEDAIGNLDALNWKYRISEKDEETFGMAPGFKNDRVNLKIKNNIVTDLYFG